MNKKLNKLMNKPVIRFFFIGSIMYLIYVFIIQLNSNTQNQDNTITITSGEIMSLEEKWTSRFKRSATELEMQSLVEQHIEETILFKEAVKMGLNKNDDVIRQRMAQKLQFLSDDLIRPEPPSDDELRDFFYKNTNSYKPADRVTITQIYLDPKKRGDKISDDAKKLLTKLNKIGSPESNFSAYGDTFNLQSYFLQRSKSELSMLFQGEFAKFAFLSEPNKWQGPVNSGYGMHIIYIHEKQIGITPEFEEIKDRIREDWMIEKQKGINNIYIDGLLSRYEIIFENQ